MRRIAHLLTLPGLLLVAAFGGAAAAQITDGAAMIRALDQAEARLDAATTWTDQRRALTDAIRAYEDALTDLRVDLGDVAGDLRARDRALAAEAGTLRAVLAALARAGSARGPLLLAAETQPEDTVRSVLVLERLAAQTSVRVDALAAERAMLDTAQAERLAMLTRLEDGRDRLGAIRAKLIDGTTLYRNTEGVLPDIGEDAANLAALAIALAVGDLTQLPPDSSALPPMDPPVAGRLIRGAGAADDSGQTRPGITVLAAPGALATAPAPASVRFVGRLDGYGQVIVLEPQAGALLILAGLDPILTRAGETLDAGQPLGFMPTENLRDPGPHEEFSAGSGDASGQLPSKPLYIELRLEQSPVDPLGWMTYDR